PLYVYERLLSALRESEHGGPFEEFTFEVNPEDIVEKGEDYVRGLMELGVNRISMGVQSFDDGILKFMNRRHNAAVAREAYAILENAGIGNISIDLIFGLPQLSDAQWADTLADALAISPSGRLPQHISAYQLSVEPGSMLDRLVGKGRFEEASEELCQRQYRMLCEALSAAGYSHYEISNFAQPGYAAVHNSAYWRHIPYVGFGPGAHSFVGSERQWNLPDLKSYIADPGSVREYETLDDEQLALEKIMLALRTSDGIEAPFLEEHCDRGALARAMECGALVRSGDGRIRIPESRFFVSDGIIADIV
ncbi:MAG: coproporphyrinogen III oxidase family protein, partial [Bacteroidales bacterium]|nr:coproporphyrinogen III oxidase family protein [Bacteroidales bacterium]